MSGLAFQGPAVLRGTALKPCDDFIIQTSNMYGPHVALQINC